MQASDRSRADNARTARIVERFAMHDTPRPRLWESGVVKQASKFQADAQWLMSPKAIGKTQQRRGAYMVHPLLSANLLINTSPDDSDSLAFRRTTAEVLNIVYNGRSTGGGFLPNQANGTIR